MTKSVIIAGAGRSGTTWVQDSLATANSMRTVFEPLHPIGVPAAREFAYQYVETGADWPELKAFMDKLFAGKHRSLWANYRIRPDRFNPLNNKPIAMYFHAKKSIGLLRKFAFKRDLSGQVVKFIRVNLMLPWLTRQYSLPTILIVRHPCAVIASRLRLSAADWDTEKALNRYRGNKAVVDLIRSQYGFDIQESMPKAAALCCVWCIENVLPMKWSKTENYAVVAYEDLMVSPETEWPRVVAHLGLHNVPDMELLGLPSQQSSLDMREREFTPAHIKKWETELNDRIKEEIATVLDHFGCAKYTVDNTLPISGVQ